MIARLRSARTSVVPQRFVISIAVLAVCFGFPLDPLRGPSAAARHASTHVKTSLLKSRRDFPLAFEPNLGQADASVKFLSRGDGYVLNLRSDEAVVELRPSTRPQVNHQAPVLPGMPAKDCAPSTIRMRVIGANPIATISGLAPLATRTNYFIGNDPARWRTNVPTFSKVRYENEYPGIDLEFYGQQRALEHDWVVRPDGNPSAIELAFDGAERLELDANGDLLMRSLSDGDVIRQHRPVAYQQVSGRQEPIDVGYVIEGEGHVKLWTAEYDRRIPLVIDPVLDYATYLGGNQGALADAIAVDADGNAYITGVTDSADFPLKDPLQPSIGSDAAVFVAKVNRDGSGLVYSTYLGGGHGNQRASGIAVDVGGHAYITGGTTATNFPVTPGAFQVAPGGRLCSSGSSQYPCSSAFVAKLSPGGNALEYASYLGGTKGEAGNAIAVDAGGNAYVTGWTASRDFPFTPRAFQQKRNRNDVSGAFVAKVSPDGHALAYAAVLEDAEGFGIAVDALGCAYVTGNATDKHPTTAGAFQTTSGSAFVTKLTPDGAALAYSTRLGSGEAFFGFSSEEVEGARAIALDAAGHAYVTGFTSSRYFPTTPGALFSSPSCNGLAPVGDDVPSGADAFITKLSADGTALEYSTYLGGCRDQGASAIAVDASGNAYVAGATTSADFPVTPDALQRTSPPGPCGDGSDTYPCLDAFLIKLNPSGTALVFSTYLGGGDEGASGVAVDSTGHVYIAGFAGDHFPTTQGAYQPLFPGGHADAFVAKVSLGTISFAHMLRSPNPNASTTARPISSGALSVRPSWKRGSRITQRSELQPR